MKINYVFTDEYTPKERRKLLLIEYIRKGLSIFNGNRKKTAAFLAISPRTLRVIMAENPYLRDEFPANIQKEHAYCPQPKSKSVDIKETRNHKSVLTYKYKVKNKTFNSVHEMAVYFEVSIDQVTRWINNKMTDERDMVRICSYPIDGAGNMTEIL